MVDALSKRCIKNSACNKYRKNINFNFYIYKTLFKFLKNWPYSRLQMKFQKHQQSFLVLKNWKSPLPGIGREFYSIYLFILYVLYTYFKISLQMYPTPWMLSYVLVIIAFILSEME